MRNAFTGLGESSDRKKAFGDLRVDRRVIVK
jgi:hypothetical protein